MWIVRLALRRPYTFVVMGLAILLLGVFAIATTPTDIFPEIEIPVVSVIWNYDGLTTEDMASRITTFSEYTISSAVSDVRSIESHTYPGVGVIKIYFQSNVNVEAALAQVTAVSQTILRRMPPGAVPPFILQYNASSVPIIQLALSGRAIPEAQLYDYGIYRIRQQVAPIQGITLPLPYGGKPRQIMVDLDPQALLAKSISAADVSAAVSLQNLTLPSGSVKLGPREYRVSLNSSPDAVAALNDLPVKVVNGATVYLRDVAHVRDGFAVQTNMVRQDGRRSVLLTVIKKGGASTLTIVKQLKALLPSIRASAPPGLEIKELFDQSLFGRAADRHARLRLDLVDLHRLRAGGVPDRPREVSLHAPGHGRRVRHAGVLSVVAHDRPHARALPAGRRGPRRGRRGRGVGRLRPAARRIPATVRAAPRGVRTCPRDRARPALARARRLRRDRGERGGTPPVHRARLLPRGGHGTVPPPRPGAGRDADRRDRAGVRGRRGSHPPPHPEGRGPAGDRQHRPAPADQPRLHRQRDPRIFGRGDPRRAESGASSADRPLDEDAPRDAAARIPGRHLLLPARGHREPDLELRAAGADRRAGHGVQPAGDSRDRARGRGPDGAHSGRGRRPPAPGGQLAVAARQRRPVARRRAGSDPARRGEHHARHTQLERGRGSELLV